MEQNPIEQQLDVAQTLAKLSSWQWEVASNQFKTSDFMHDLLGYPEDISLGYEQVFRFIDSNQQERFEARWRHSLDTLEPLEFRGVIYKADETACHVEIFAEVVADATGTAVALTGAIQDVTLRVGALLALQRSEERLRAIYEGSSHSILLLGLDSTIIQCNHAFSKLVGYAGTDLLGRQLQTFVVPDDQPRFLNELESLIDDEFVTNFSLEVRCIGHQSKLFWADLTISLVRDKNGSPSLLIAILEDVSNQRAVELELAQARNQLSRSRDKAQQFLAQELHDGPIQDLHAARFKLQTLRAHVTSEKGLQTLSQTQELFQQSLDSLRTIMGELRPPALAPFGLAAAIRSHVGRFRELYPDLEVRMRLAADGQQLPEEVRLALFRVCQEFLNNIVKHAQASRVWVSLNVTENQATLSVRDNGKGFLPPAHLYMLARDGHLGLLGSEERIRDVGGQMTVRSVPEQGSELQVSVPISVEANS